MLVKIDITEHCILDNLPEVGRVFACYRAPDNEVTYICSPVKMIFCEDLGTQVNFLEGVSDERREEIEEIFQESTLDNTYYQASLIDNLPRVEWGGLPPFGAAGCVIEADLQTKNDALDYTLGESFKDAETLQAFVNSLTDEEVRMFEKGLSELEIEDFFANGG